MTSAVHRARPRGRRAVGIPLVLVSTRQPSSALLRQAVAHLAPVLPLLTDLGERFAAAGHDLALVGGPVRDALLGRAATDLDFTTSARPDDTEAVLAAWGSATWDMGREFGTIGARRGGTVVEVTTYRADAYDGRTRKPVVAFGDSLDDDLVRRDFTVNAMALRLPDLAFVDPHGGLGDLDAGLLRTPSPPEVSFGDDPLRMMRAARFVAQLGLVPAPEVVTAMREMAASIAIVSAERVRDELVKLLLGAAPARRARAAVRERPGATTCCPSCPRSSSRSTSTTATRTSTSTPSPCSSRPSTSRGPPDGPPESVPGPDLVLRLAALLHDIGKPATRRFEAGGGVSFHHHEVVGAKLVARRLRALRFDKDTTKAVARLVELHLRFHGYGEGQWTDSAVRRYITDAGPLLPRLHRLTRADCTTRNVRKARRLAADLRRPRAADRAAARAGGAQGGAPGARRQRDRGGPRHPARAPCSAAPTSTCSRVRLDEGPIGPDAARERLLAWWAEQPESRA